MISRNFTVRTVGCALALLSLTVAGFAQATFNRVGDIPGGVLGSQVRAATETGRIAVGVGSSAFVTNPNSGNGDRQVLWTLRDGISELPQVTAGTITVAPFMTASDITPDGLFIAGRALATPTNTGRVAVIWSSANGFSTPTVLGANGTIPGSAGQFAAALAISDNGQIVFGFGTSATSGKTNEAFRWDATSNTIVGLGFLDAQTHTNSIVAARGVSADGSVAVGSSGTTTFGVGSNAFRFTSAGGMTSIGTLAGGTWSSAIGISSDGSTIFGLADSTANPDGEFFIATTAAGIVAQGAAFAASNLGGISADGSIFVSGQNLHNALGFSVVTSVLIGAGLDVTGWSNFSAFGISDNAEVLWGSALNPEGNTEGWVATFQPGFLGSVQAVPEPSTWALLILGLGLVGWQVRRRSA